MNEDEKPCCRKCEYFYITFEMKNPNGCKAYGFKGPSLPSAVVERESGLPCMKFKLKKSLQKKKDDIDFNDPSIW